MPPIDRTLALDPWKPDSAVFGRQGLKVAKGGIRTETGYDPAPTLAVVSDTVVPDFAGADAMWVGEDITATQIFRTYVGNKSAIYEAIGTPIVWTDVSKAGGYTVPLEDKWRVVQFDGDIFATQIADPVQFVTVSVGGLYADTGALSIPKARYMGVVDDNYLVLGNLDDPVGGILNNRFAWSPFRNPFGDWGDIATTSDQSSISNLGDITGVESGRWGTILLRNGVARLTPSPGGLEPFQLDVQSQQVGCDFPASAITVNELTYWFARSGIHMFDGERVHPIGRQWVDKWLQAELVTGQEFRIQPSYDADLKVIRWLFTAPGSTDNVPNRVLTLEPTLGQQGFSYQDVDGYVLGTFVPPGTNLDLNPYATLDGPLPPLDGPFWQSGNPQAGAINAEGKVATFSGPADDAEFTWPEGQLASAAQRAKLLAALPITEGGSPSVQISLREKLNDNLTSGPDIVPQEDGSVALFDEARYHTITMKQSGDWLNASGLQVSGVTTGVRG